MPPTFSPPGRRSARQYDAERRTAIATRRLYSTARWQAIRDAQLAAEPLCRMCAADGRDEAATVCDHVEPHRGDVAAFWAGPFQSLCGPHHNRDKQRAERHGR
jgi:5-methylcytosine-specific restriction protein A